MTLLFFSNLNIIKYYSVAMNFILYICFGLTNHISIDKKNRYFINTQVNSPLMILL